MPQSPSTRRTHDDPELPRDAERSRLFAADHSELTWVRQTLARLRLKQSASDFSEQDRFDLKTAELVLDRAQTPTPFSNSNQPRDNRGRWTQSFDVGKAVAYLEEHGRGVSQNKCAAFVRGALAAGGVNLRPSGDAKNYGQTLRENEFEPVAQATDHQGLPPTNLSEPSSKFEFQKGDIVVMKPYNGSPSQSGHMAMFTGQRWILDFTQQDIWPNREYANHKPSYVIYRHTSKN